MARQTEMLDILVADLVATRDALTAATRVGEGGVELDRSALWECAGHLAACTQYASRLRTNDGYGAVRMIGEWHAPPQ